MEPGEIAMNGLHRKVHNIVADAGETVTLIPFR